jgi:protein-serine/threonine kinase
MVMPAIMPDRNGADKSGPSPTLSTTSSLNGSAAGISRPATGQDGNLAANDNFQSAAPHLESSSKPTEKQSMTKRLTRMFSVRDPTKTTPSDSGTNTPLKSSNTPLKSSSPPSEASSSASRPVAPPRQMSPSEKLATTMSKPSTPKPKEGSPLPSQRFEVLPGVPGGHEHHLKSARRQEKLSDMLRDMLGGKKKTDQAHEGEQQLSLMSSWVDQLKHERENVASTKIGGPNQTATLVEKYGKCHEIVGRGAFGIVRISHKRREGENEQLYAVKEFRRRPDESEKRYSKRLTAEFCISSSLRHPNVIHTLDLLQDSKGDYCEVMEFCAGGDLYTLVLAAGKLEVAEADCYFKQLMRGVEYMHEMGVAHRDLKPENLLLTTHGALKITDFGNGECFRMAWETDPHMVTGLCGSAPYIAPEEYVDKEFDARAVDIWATGVIYMAMRTGRHLWRVARRDEDEFYDRYLEGRRDEEGYGPIESLHRVSPFP